MKNFYLCDVHRVDVVHGVVVELVVVVHIVVMDVTDTFNDFPLHHNTILSIICGTMKPHCKTVKWGPFY